MKEYELPAETRSKLQPHYRLFQVAVAVLANHEMDIEVDHPQGIFKWEGGVVINEREIVINYSLIYDDFNRSKHELPEEVAVAIAIYTLAAQFEAQGVEAFEPYMQQAKLFMGDPLRSFFGL